MSVLSELRRSLTLIAEFVRPSMAEDRSIPPLDGGLSANDHLDGFQVVWESHDLEPDDVLVRADGSILFSAGDQILHRVAGRAAVFASLPGRVAALATDEADGLFAVVDGEGLFRLAEGLAPQRVGDLRPSCATSLACAGGHAYVTMGSTAFGPEQWMHDLMTKGATGSLVRVDLATGRADTLRSGLAWPGGVALGPDGRVLVSEAWRHRIVAHDLATATTVPLQTNLPGYPMRINADGRGGYLVAFVALRTHLIDFVLREDYYREEMVRTVDSAYWISPALRTAGERWEPLQIGSIKHLNQTKPWSPSRSYGLLARLSADGTFTESWHARAASPRSGVMSGRASGDGVVVACKGGRMVLSNATGEESR